MNKLNEIQKYVQAVELIEVSEGTVKANTTAHEQALKQMTIIVDDIVENDIDSKVIEEKLKDAKATVKAIKDYRMPFTEPLRGIPSKFTAIEKDMDEQVKRIDAHYNVTMERVYKVREDAIALKLSELLGQNEELNIKLSMFDDFIEKQRMIKGMQPSEKGELSKASIDKIESKFEEFAKPIRDKIEKAKALETQQRLFEKAVPKIEGLTEIDEFEAARLEVETLGKSIEQDYPLYATYAHNSISNILGTINAKIEAIKDRDKRKALEEQNKKDKEHEEEQKRAKFLADERQRKLDAEFDEPILANTRNTIIDGEEYIKDDLYKKITTRIRAEEEAKQNAENQEVLTLNFSVTGERWKLREVKALMDRLELDYKSI